ncbi:hypothetical protein [Solemya velesiana gill symbiont]|uniref:Uncharacterized protein n=1 Tax=Solemya velesiana gill symbiont TaxID=1918948 RepID=A0A1T2KVC9_9GAMM|nr:hypothetical protein [Solemya velesiana gill symbiont]OOZ36807.1 hypothetical protein BOW51_05315 [Solemya velesiana gill symbiont]
MTDENRKDSNGKSSHPFSVDEQGIPILNDVVDDWQPGRTDNDLADQSREPADHAELRKTVRDRLKDELEEELGQLIEQAVEQTLSSVMADFHAVAKKKLSRLVKKRSSELLEQILDSELKRNG